LAGSDHPDDERNGLPTLFGAHSLPDGSVIGPFERSIDP